MEIGPWAWPAAPLATGTARERGAVKVSIEIVGDDFRITIPKAVRDALSISKREKIRVYAEGGRIILEKVTKDPLEASFGAWAGEKNGVDYVETLRRDWTERDTR